LLLFVFSICGFASAVVTRSLDPLVTSIARDFGVPAATAALLASAFTLPYALGQPVLGPLGDVIGKTTVLKVCIWCLVACLGISAFMPSFPLLLMMRPFTGVFAGGIMPIAMAILSDRYPASQRQLVIARFLTTALVGQVVGASGSGLLASVIGWRGILFSCAIVAVVAAIGASFAFPRATTAKREPFRFADIQRGYAKVFSNFNAYVCFGIVLVEGITIFGVAPFFAEMLETSHTGGAREAGFIIAGIGVGGIVYSLSLGLILRFATRRSMMAAGGSIAALGLLGISFIPAWAPDVGFYSMTGFGFFMLHNSVQAEVSELAPLARGTAYSMHAFSFFVGQAIGPLVFGPLHVTIGAGPTLQIMAIILTISAIAASRLLRRDMISGILGR
jgi:predicted MFS family arabinose efflux permease